MLTALFFIACVARDVSPFAEQMHTAFTASFVGERSLDKSATEIGSGLFTMRTTQGEKKTQFYAFAWKWDPCANVRVVTLILDQEADKPTTDKWLQLISDYPTSEGNAYFETRDQYALARPDGTSIEWVAKSDHTFNVINLPIGTENYSKGDLGKILHRALDRQVERNAIRDVQYVTPK